jgi:hypothetical protein
VNIFGWLVISLLRQQEIGGSYSFYVLADGLEIGLMLFLSWRRKTDKTPTARDMFTTASEASCALLSPNQITTTANRKAALHHNNSNLICNDYLL